MKMNNYDHKKIESKWQKDWEKRKVYKTSDNSKKKKYYVLDMFPYPSGDGLHVGHPKGYIATDIISRMKRMQGHNVLHPMGFDAFGLPAENYAIKMKTNPAVAVAKNVARFKKQLEIIGLDYDWSREINTTDPNFYKWTEWTFLKLLEKGLAYESYEPINWCPSCKTGLANEDVEDGKCERCGTSVEQKPMRQWVIRITKYAEKLLKDLDLLDWPESIKESQRNWIGKSEGSEIEFKVRTAEKFSSGPRTREDEGPDHSENLFGSSHSIKVFTTRADTLFGATYVVVAPEHKIITDDQLPITNKKEVVEYINLVKNKTDLERTSLDKTKSGVELKGIKAINPANGEEIPVWIADYVLAGYGTGAVMAVPAHDERDFEFAKKFNLPIKQVVEPNFIGDINKDVPTVERNAISAIIKHWSEDKYLCLKWKKANWITFVTGGIEKGQTPEEAARAEILEETGFSNLDLIRALPNSHSMFYHIPKGENRFAHFNSFYFKLKDGKQEKVIDEEKEKHEVVWLTAEEIEKLLTPEGQKYDFKIINGHENAYVGYGILNNSGDFNKMTSEEARKKITEFVGGKIVTKYKLRDWVFSRQRYWGEPIPVLHDGDKVVPVKEKDLPVVLPKVKSYEPTGTGESPLASIDKWVNVKVGNKILKRETNTMPQWAGSSWYYLRYMDPKNNKALVDKNKEKYWNQVDFYVGGAEHATRHLIYARFWHKFLYDLGVVSTKEPFKKLQSVGLIMGEDGRKMSKRFGNVVNPDEIVKLYGADTLRVYEMFIGPFDQTVVWSTKSIIGSRRFLEKVWKVAQKIQINTDREILINSDKKSVYISDPKNQGQSVNFSIEKLLHKTIKKVSEDIESMNFNTAISSMMILVNEMESASTLGHGVTKEDFKKFLKILSPFAPHITEDLWSTLGEKKSIHLSEWPKWDKNRITEEEFKIVVQVNGKVRAEIIITKDIKEEEIKKIALENKQIIPWILNHEIKKVIYVPGRVINIVI